MEPTKEFSSISRCVFTESETAKLVQSWNEGMTSKSHDKVTEMADQLGKSVTQIKNWIGNYRQKVTGVTYQRKKEKAHHLTSWNMFVKEQGKGKMVNSSAETLALEWGELSVAEKQQYSERAKEEMAEMPEKSRKKEDIIKDIKRNFKDLNSLGISSGGLILDGSNIIVCGQGQASLFMRKNTQSFVTHLAAFSEGGPDTSDCETTRREVQSILRKKYKEAFGKSITYKSSDSNKSNEIILLEGLKTAVQLKRPSSYGMDTKRDIIAHKNSLRMTRIPNPESTEVPVNVKSPEHAEHAHIEPSNVTDINVMAMQVLEELSPNSGEVAVEEVEDASKADDIEKLLSQIDAQKSFQVTSIDENLQGPSRKKRRMRKPASKGGKHPADDKSLHLRTLVVELHDFQKKEVVQKSDASCDGGVGYSN